MRRSIFLLLFVSLCWTNHGDAQPVKHYGLKVALTSANLDYYNTYAPELTTQRMLGVNVGVFVEWLDVPFFSLVTQVEYVQKGMSIEFTFTDSQGPSPVGKQTLYSRLHYLSFPIFGKFRFKAGPVAPYVMAGPRLDFILAHNSDMGVFSEVYEKYKKPIVGVSVGAGVQTESILPFTVLIEARYNMDLTYSYSNDVVHVSNNSFDLWLGVAI